MDFDLLPWIRNLVYYLGNWTGKMMLRRGRIFRPVECFDLWAILIKTSRIAFLDNAALYIVPANQLPFLISTVGSIITSVTNTGPFHMATLYTIAEMFLRNLEVLFDRQRKACYWKRIEILKNQSFIRALKALHICRVFIAISAKTGYEGRSRKQAWRNVSAGRLRQIIRDVPNFYTHTDPVLPKRLFIGKTAYLIPRSIEKHWKVSEKEDREKLFL